MTFFITSRCNLRCEHCFYWKELDADHSSELKIDEIVKIAKSIPRLLVLSLTGGEPFVRKDLAEVVNVFVKETRVHIITIHTNGYYIERMEQLVPKMLSDNPDTNIIFYISIDGPEKIHDKIRGEGSYRKAMETLQMLQPFRKEYENMGISVSMTCSNSNQDSISEEFERINESGLTDNVNIGFVRGDPKLASAKEVELENYKKVTELKVKAAEERKLGYPKNMMFSDLVELKNKHTNKIVEHIIEHDRYVLPCQAGNLMGILYDDGAVKPCEILEDSDFGNIRDFDYDMMKLWNTARAKSVKKEIKNGCYCTFECALSSSILFNPKYLAGIGTESILNSAKSLLGRQKTEEQSL